MDKHAPAGDQTSEPNTPSSPANVMRPIALPALLLVTALLTAFVWGCGPDRRGGRDDDGENNGGVNNGVSNNGATNNGVTNNGVTNNGVTNNGATNNGVTNNGATNNGVTNNGSTNNGTANNGVTNNGVTNNGVTNHPPTIERFAASAATLTDGETVVFEATVSDADGLDDVTSGELIQGPRPIGTFAAVGGGRWEAVVRWADLGVRDLPAPEDRVFTATFVDRQGARATATTTLTVTCGDVEGCSGRCVDTGSDPNHCGVCRRVCSGADICDDGVCGLPCPTNLTGLVINEVDYDQPSTDGMEFVEIYNGTGQAVCLGSLRLLLVNGGDRLPYATFDLSEAGVMLGAGGYLVVASSAVAIPGTALRIAFPRDTNRIQNGDAEPDGVALFDLRAGVLVDALSYEGALTAAEIEGQVVSLVEGTATAAVDVGDTDGALARLPNGRDTNDAATDWAFTNQPTPGAANR